MPWEVTWENTRTHQEAEKEVELSLFINNMIIDVENSKESSKNY